VVENAEFGTFVQMLCPEHHISQQEGTERLIPIKLCVVTTSVPCEIIYIYYKRSRLKCSILPMILFPNAKLE
jgi:hypothetical protein